MGAPRLIPIDTPQLATGCGVSGCPNTATTMVKWEGKHKGAAVCDDHTDTASVAALEPADDA